MSRYELRECRGCDGSGDVVVDAIYEPKTGQLVQVLETCSTCKGIGRVPLYVYRPLSRTDVRKAATQMLMWVAWNGTIRERKLAEKEIARREGSQWR